jgi:hypothetical protein
MADVTSIRDLIPPVSLPTAGAPSLQALRRQAVRDFRAIWKRREQELAPLDGLLRRRLLW